MTKWRDYLPKVVNIINFHHETVYKSNDQMLKAYFTSPKTVIPQTIKKMYKFKLNQKVRIDTWPSQRKNLSFKYSLNRGNYFIKHIVFTICFTKVLLFLRKNSK